MGLRSYNSKIPSEVDYTIWEAGRATSVASTFFNPIKIGQFGEQFIDSATGYNNPIERVWEEAKSLWPDFDDRCSQHWYRMSETRSFWHKHSAGGEDTGCCLY